MLTLNKRLLFIVVTVFSLLLIPFIGMQFTSEINWSVSDFVVMGILLLTTGLLINFALYKLKKPVLRIIAVVTIVLLFLLLWIELAVGIFNSPLSGS